jgi:hypothetical protein
MNLRWEVTEADWVDAFLHAAAGSVDYVRIDLEKHAVRPWLDDARATVELVGSCQSEATVPVLERALELDVDFLCLGAGPGELDPRRLPLRLMVEQALDHAPNGPDLAGAVWARRVRGWEEADPARLERLARRERLVLVAARALPSRELLERVQPFAVAAPIGTRPEQLSALKGE